MTTTPPSARILAVVTTFWTQRPDATPTTLIAVNSATSPAASAAVRDAGQERSRARNSAPATPIAAIAAPFTPTLSIHPTTNPARRPNASRAYTYLPPARGYRVASSANTSAPSNASAPPNTHATNVSPGRPSWFATSPGVRKIPEPTMMPTTMARPSNKRSDRFSSMLTGRNGRSELRELLEAQAELIETHGYLGAMRLSLRFVVPLLVA